MEPEQPEQPEPEPGSADATADEDTTWLRRPAPVVDGMGPAAAGLDDGAGSCRWPPPTCQRVPGHPEFFERRQLLRRMGD